MICPRSHSSNLVVLFASPEVWPSTSSALQAQEPYVCERRCWLQTVKSSLEKVESTSLGCRSPRLNKDVPNSHRLDSCEPRERRGGRCYKKEEKQRWEMLLLPSDWQRGGGKGDSYDRILLLVSRVNLVASARGTWPPCLRPQFGPYPKASGNEPQKGWLPDYGFTCSPTVWPTCQEGVVGNISVMVRLLWQ